ncbi:MAG: DUF5317 family protein [Eubacteriaceae bacterium]|nr:DUF5317 family protein [Eubacteriaceae bacterium]
MFITSALLFSATVFGLASDITLIVENIYIITLLAYCSLLLAILINLRGLNIWMFLLLSGVLINFTVVFLNNGLMPYSRSALEIAGLPIKNIQTAPNSYLSDPTTRLAYLGWVIPIPFPFLPEVVSPGIVLLGLGLAGTAKNLLLGISYDNIEDSDEEFIDIGFDEYGDDDALDTDTLALLEKGDDNQADGQALKKPGFSFREAFKFKWRGKAKNEMEEVPALPDSETGQGYENSLNYIPSDEDVEDITMTTGGFFAFDKDSATYEEEEGFWIEGSEEIYEQIPALEVEPELLEDDNSSYAEFLLQDEAANSSGKNEEYWPDDDIGSVTGANDTQQQLEIGEPLLGSDDSMYDESQATRVYSLDLPAMLEIENDSAGTPGQSANPTTQFNMGSPKIEYRATSQSKPIFGLPHGAFYSEEQMPSQNEAAPEEEKQVGELANAIDIVAEQTAAEEPLLAEGWVAEDSLQETVPDMDLLLVDKTHEDGGLEDVDGSLAIGESEIVDIEAIVDIESIAAFEPMLLDNSIAGEEAALDDSEMLANVADDAQQGDLAPFLPEESQEDGSPEYNVVIENIIGQGDLASADEQTIGLGASSAGEDIADSSYGQSLLERIDERTLPQERSQLISDLASQQTQEQTEEDIKIAHTANADDSDIVAGQESGKPSADGAKSEPLNLHIESIDSYSLGARQEKASEMTPFSHSFEFVPSEETGSDTYAENDPDDETPSSEGVFTAKTRAQRLQDQEQLDTSNSKVVKNPAPSSFESLMASKYPQPSSTPPPAPEINSFAKMAAEQKLEQSNANSISFEMGTPSQNEEAIEIEEETVEAANTGLNDEIVEEQAADQSFDIETEKEQEDIEFVGENMDHGDPMETSSPFIIVKGRIVENPYYKFRRGSRDIPKENSNSFQKTVPQIGNRNPSLRAPVKPNFSSTKYGSASAAQESPSSFDKLKRDLAQQQLEQREQKTENTVMAERDIRLGNVQIKIFKQNPNSRD